MLLLLEIVALLWTVFVACCQAVFRAVIPKPRKSVAGNVVLVTGAGRGIGKEIALRFARLKANVILWDVNQENLDAAANEIRELGVRCEAYRCDVTNYEDVKKKAAEVRNAFGDVDILVNNAGVLAAKDVLSLDEQTIRRTFDVNAIAHFWTVKEFLPAMIERNNGHIVAVASSAAIVGTPLVTDYCASKFACDGFMQALVEELRRYKRSGIRTTTVYPLFVNTGLLADIQHRVEGRQRFSPFLEPTEVADAIVDGALRNKRSVFVPRIISVVPLLKAILPERAVNALIDFLDVGFYPTSQ